MLRKEPGLSNSITIRQEREQDFGQVREVVRQAFRDVAESDHTEHLLVERLRTGATYVPELSLVAETGDGQIVGHILLTEVEVVSAGQVFTALALAPLSVSPAFQGRGIGSRLIREAHSRAATLGYGLVVVLGHAGYYPRFGYRRASLYGIDFPFDAPDGCRMVAELTGEGLEGVHGMVRYPDAFLV